MKYRRLGKTDLMVSEIGFGAWGIGDGWGTQDDAEATNALHRSFDLGMNFYDTALGYGNGHSEALIGKAFRKERNSVIIASKIPPHKTAHGPVNDNDPLSAVFSKEWIISCTEKTLKNLGSDYVDLQQLHAWTNAYTYQDEWREAFLKLKQDGKIRAFGVSVNDWDAYGGVNLAKSGRVDSIQIIYNIFEQRPEEGVLPAALENGVGILARVPFEEGLLSGALYPGYKFTPGDWRGQWLPPERLDEAAKRVEALKQFLTPQTPTLASLALKFILGNPAVSTVIPGMRRISHVDANAQVSDSEPLDAATLAKLKEHAFVHGWAYPWYA